MKLYNTYYMAISDLTKEQIEEYAKESNNWKEFMTKCGYTNFGCTFYIKRKLELFDISVSHFTRGKHNKKYTHEEIFKVNSQYTSMKCIKHKLITHYNWEYKCSSCKLSEWMTKKIPIEIDHINGNHTDNRIENLRFLCPNCHALTDTYKGKNIKNKEHSKDKYNIIKIKKTCKECGNIKYKNSEFCLSCHLKLKINKTTNKIIKKCINCETIIKKESERCMKCYKDAKKEGNHEKQLDNITNMKKCPDCDKYISKKSLRCRLCHYALMKSKSDVSSKQQIKGECIDCNTKIVNRAIRCTSCSNRIIENANKSILKDIITIDSKTKRPSYNQLVEDKTTLSMIQIGKKYGVSDNTIRKWLKKYETEYKP